MDAILATLNSNHFHFLLRIPIGNLSAQIDCFQLTREKKTIPTAISFNYLAADLIWGGHFELKISEPLNQIQKEIALHFFH